MPWSAWGVLLTDTNRAGAPLVPAGSRRGRAGSMAGLANLAADNDPEQARRWLEQAAEAGRPLVIHILSLPFNLLVRVLP